jgi:hypothetical protein
MPGITLDLSDAAELAETLTFLADWLSGSQKQVLAGSLAAFVWGAHSAADPRASCRYPYPSGCPLWLRGGHQARTTAPGGRPPTQPESPKRGASRATFYYYGGYTCCSGRLADHAVWPAPEPKTGPAHRVAEVQCRVGMAILGEGGTCVILFQREFWVVCSDRTALYQRRVDPVEEVLNLRGSLRGKTVLDGADSGSPPLACASVLAGPELYLRRGNRSAGHGKEKVYGSIP